MLVLAIYLTPFGIFSPCTRQLYIETDENLKTTVEGIYAAGDVRKCSLKQVVAASSDGAVAATSAGEYLESLREQDEAGI
ncbi:hypothetical protein HKBW3S06_01369 [Candidatus Hakubella thermalkaliphila]|uniref:FAD/NAD(P)-binding domain-containing protein n=1 Tax=Candidatus Hakubella thermalkaliphila TaxID=2754717 RepID=A0A6V8NP82_9ACTN|nr:FAD-dependent oxidoreductase [Candidatus Hakubella thermalkaliphila]GFP22142.1 hypothetical protein HKBW3S06_01369 [Candidatus Hakubella thermalkaliphila]